MHTLKRKEQTSEDEILRHLCKNKQTQLTVLDYGSSQISYVGSISFVSNLDSLFYPLDYEYSLQYARYHIYCLTIISIYSLGLYLEIFVFFMFFLFRGVLFSFCLHVYGKMSCLYCFKSFFDNYYAFDQISRIIGPIEKRMHHNVYKENLCHIYIPILVKTEKVIKKSHFGDSQFKNYRDVK